MPCAVPKKRTKHFRVKEWQSRDGAPYPARWIKSRWLKLAKTLELVRAYFNAPVTIVSGYRSPAHNRAVGGVKKSQHTAGRAADIVVKGYSSKEVHAMILSLHREGVIKIGGLGHYKKFVHVDTRPSKRLARWRGRGVT